MPSDPLTSWLVGHPQPESQRGLDTENLKLSEKTEKTQYQHRYINWSSPDDLAGCLGVYDAKSTSPPTSTRTLIDSSDHGRVPRHRFQEVHELLVASFLRQVIRCFALHNYAQLKFWEMRKGDGRINYDMLGLGLLKSGFLSGRYPSYCIYTRLYSISLRKIDPENASMINMLQQQSTSFPPSKASASEPRHHHAPPQAPTNWGRGRSCSPCPSWFSLRSAARPRWCSCCALLHGAPYRLMLLDPVRIIKSSTLGNHVFFQMISHFHCFSMKTMKTTNATGHWSLSRSCTVQMWSKIK